MTSSSLGRISAGFALAMVVCSLGPAPKDELVAERRDAHTRELRSCGTKKACIKKSADVAPSAPGVRSRWTEHEYDDVRVWIAPGEGNSRWRPQHRIMVRDAFHAWSDAGAPVHFVFVSDSLRADVHVLWRDRLPAGRAGQVTRLVDRRGWLRAATIEMSTRKLAGGARDSKSVRAVALHEVGHLLGIEHSDDERDIMAAWVTARSLTERDRAAMRALYDVVDH